MHKVFKVLGEEHRYRIFAYLAKYGDSCVCDLEQLMDVKQANLSKHLKRMKDAGIVESHHEGNFVHYSISSDFSKEYEVLVEYIKQQNTELKITKSCEVT